MVARTLRRRSIQTADNAAAAYRVRGSLIAPRSLADIAWRNHTSPRYKSRNVRKSDMCYRRIRTDVRASVPRYAVNVECP